MLKTMGLFSTFVNVFLVYANIRVVFGNTAVSQRNDNLPNLGIERTIKYDFEEYKDRCTSVGVGPKATVDGST